MLAGEAEAGGLVKARCSWVLRQGPSSNQEEGPPDHTQRDTGAPLREIQHTSRRMPETQQNTGCADSLGADQRRAPGLWIHSCVA